VPPRNNNAGTAVDRFGVDLPGVRPCIPVPTPFVFHGERHDQFGH
jgi:hypothetical protein